MKKLLFAFLFLVGCTTPGDGPTAWPTTPTTNPTMPGVPVDVSKIPPPSSYGEGDEIIVPATYSKGPGDGSAAFRVNCRYSHFNFDDPIVFPGVKNATHLHIFAGNTDVDHRSTPQSVHDAGNSTCTGGIANRTAYWAPAIIDTATGAPVMPGNSTVDIDNFLQVYYKTGYDGVPPHTVQNFPRGLRMVAGNAFSSSPQSVNVVHYSCDNGTPRNNMGSCPPGSLLVFTVDFPQCWDGVNLDSPDHKSHMAYGAGWPDKGCPSTHPVPLPKITQNYRYRVPTSGMSTWRLASDMYEGPAGYSGHADWMNGWDPDVFQRVVDNCYAGGFDCSMNLLGDGWMLGMR